jgi:hypothetical protein
MANQKDKSSPSSPGGLAVPLPAQSQLLTEQQAAAFLGIRPATLQAWRSSGRVRLDFAKLGRTVRYRQCDLDNFVQAHVRATTA